MTETDEYESCAALHLVGELDCKDSGLAACDDMIKEDCGDYLEEGVVKIMSFNLYGWKAWGEKGGKDMCKYIQASEKYGFDLFGAQELDHGAENMQNTCWPGAKKLGDQPIYVSPESDVECDQAKGHNVKGNGAQNRWVSSAKCRKGDKEFIFSTGHWCVSFKGHMHECCDLGTSCHDREENARLTVEALDREAGGKLPIIYTCDCNSQESTTAISYMKTHGFKIAQKGSSHGGVDFIMTKNFPNDPVRAWVAKGRHTSDHNAVFAHLSL